MLSSEQVELRAHGLGSSDMSAVASENPYWDVHRVWLVKRGLLDTSEPTDATWLGHEMEPIVAKRYTIETGVELVDGPGTVAHPEHPWALATTDREYTDRSRIVECKWVGQRVAWHWTLEADGAPPYVLIQGQWQMFVRNIPRLDVAVIFGGTADFRIYELQRDEAMIGALLKIGERFWFDRVLAGTPPPVDETRSARHVLEALFPRHLAPLKPAPVEAEKWFELRQQAEARREEAQEEFDLASNKLRECIGDAAGIVGDWGRATWKADKRGVKSLRVYPRKELAA